MIASSTKQRRLPLAQGVTLLAGIFWVGAALAAPIPLTPPPATEPPALPEAPPAPSEPPVPRPNGVKVEALATIDPDGFGLNDDRETKFTGPQWTGTGRALALTLFEHLPSALPSPSLRLLQRRLLVAPTNLPLATGPDSPSSLGIRAAKLAAMGDGAAAQALLQLMPDRLRGEPSAHASLDQLWISNQTEAACTALDKQFSAYRGPYWQQARVACQALAGQKSEAQIGSQALRDEGVDDPVFFALLDTQGVAKPPPLPSGNWTPIDLALATVFSRDVPATAMVSADVRMAAVLAKQGKYPAAIAAYKWALGIDYDSVIALQGLAWIRATSPDAGLRNGAEAVELARHAVELTGRKQPLLLTVLDAALAENGQFDEAIKTAQETESLARSLKQGQIADQAHARIELYKSKKPFHQ